MKKIILGTFLTLLLMFILLIIVFNFVPKQKLVSIIPSNLYKNIKNSTPKNIFSVIQVIFDNERSTNRINNDYNEKFLPDTQFVKLNLNKINLDFLETNTVGYANFLKKSRKTFYIENDQRNIFALTKNGNLYFIKTENLLSNNEKFNEIKTNLDNFVALDFLVNDQNIFLSGYLKGQGCNQLVIYKSEIDYEKIDFSVIRLFNDCFESIQAGKIELLNEKTILLSTGADILKKDDETDEKPQDPLSPYGKILEINVETSEIEYFSMGHRNILGLLVDGENIISTENGPAGGDEINLIKKKGNYGWPLASYGEKYSHGFSDKLTYLKSHESNNFIEPIFSFVPSIGISEIISLDDNFAKTRQNNYLIGSLNSNHIFRFKFDNDFKSTIYYEKIFIKERIRDLLYLKDNKAILLALENSGSIGILTKKDSE